MLAFLGRGGNDIVYCAPTRLKKRLKITQLEKMRFIKVNVLKLTQVELFSFFHFMCAADNISEFFCMTHLANNERFLYHTNLTF